MLSAVHLFTVFALIVNSNALILILLCTDGRNSHQSNDLRTYVFIILSCSVTSIQPGAALSHGARCKNQWPGLTVSREEAPR